MSCRVVNPEVIVLALASAVRPSGLAAVYALLATASPRRLLILLPLFTGVGAYFVVKGAVILLG